MSPSPRTKRSFPRSRCRQCSPIVRLQASVGSLGGMFCFTSSRSCLVHWPHALIDTAEGPSVVIPFLLPPVSQREARPSGDLMRSTSTPKVQGGDASPGACKVAPDTGMSPRVTEQPKDQASAAPCVFSCSTGGSTAHARQWAELIYDLFCRGSRSKVGHQPQVCCPRKQLRHDQQFQSGSCEGAASDGSSGLNVRVQSLPLPRASMTSMASVPSIYMDEMASSESSESPSSRKGRRVTTDIIPATRRRRGTEPSPQHEHELRTPFRLLKVH